MCLDKLHLICLYFNYIAEKEEDLSSLKPMVRNNSGSRIVRRRLMAKTRPVPKPRKTIQNTKKVVSETDGPVCESQNDQVQNDNNKPKEPVVPTYRSRRPSYKWALDSDSEESDTKSGQADADEGGSTKSAEERDQISTKYTDCDTEEKTLELLPDRDNNDNVLPVSVSGNVNDKSPPAIRPCRKAPPPPLLKQKSVQAPVPAPRNLHKTSSENVSTNVKTDCLFIHPSDSLDIPVPLLKAPAPPPSPFIESKPPVHNVTSKPPPSPDLTKPPRPERPGSMRLHNKKKQGHRPPEESLDDLEYLVPLEKNSPKALPSPAGSSQGSVDGSDLPPSSDNVQLPTKKPHSKRRSLTNFLVSVKDTISGISNTTSRKSTGRSPDQQATFYYNTVQLEDIAKSIELSRRMSQNSNNSDVASSSSVLPLSIVSTNSPQELSPNSIKNKTKPDVIHERHEETESDPLPKAPPRLKRKQAAERQSRTSGAYKVMSGNVSQLKPTGETTIDSSHKPSNGGSPHSKSSGRPNSDKPSDVTCSDNRNGISHDSDDQDEYIYPDVLVPHVSSV